MIGLIGGTGLGEALFGEIPAQTHRPDTPFGQPSSPIHVLEWNGVRVALLARHGAGHLFNPARVPYRANIYALKQLGVTHILASGAVGSLREEIKPRDLVIVDQLIDKTHARPRTFFDDGLAVHVEFAEPFCPDLRQALLAAANRVPAKVHDAGTYVCMEGPAFSTIAEARLHRQWGADLIGMTALPEARLAREAEICYALVALVTDYDCWRPHEPGATPRKLLEEIVANLQAATGNAVTLLKAAIETLATRPLGSSPIHSALELAIWSERSRIPQAVYEKYGILLSKYAPR